MGSGIRFPFFQTVIAALFRRNHPDSFSSRALKSREERMVTPAMGAAMIGPSVFLTGKPGSAWRR